VSFSLLFASLNGKRVINRLEAWAQRRRRGKKKEGF